MIVRFGLSSIHIGDSARRPMPFEIRVQSSSRRLPSRMFLASTLASAHSNRWLSSRWPISRLNTSTGRFSRTAACAAMLSANEVLPMAGRAPTIVSELGWSPDNSSSRSMKPVGVPVMPCPCS